MLAFCSGKVQKGLAEMAKEIGGTFQVKVSHFADQVGPSKYLMKLYQYIELINIIEAGPSAINKLR